MRLSFALIVFPLVAFCRVASPAEPEAERTLRVIDFEERRLGNPEELPMHWTKVQGPGLPHYVNGRLASDQARSGKYSFRFDLNGGSLIYRFEPGRIKVAERAHYRVETYVRTTELPHARARLSAYFADSIGQPVAGSIRHSPLYVSKAADDDWHKLSVELSAQPGAASLVVELALLQPSRYTPDATLGDRTLFPQDIHGTAWFDDVAVSQVPKVRLGSDRPGHIFRPGQQLGLHVLINDRSTDDLAAQLVIRDAQGRTVYQRSGALDMAAAEMLDSGFKRTHVVLPDLPPGWYEAALVMTSRGKYVGRHTMDLVLLADNAPDPRPDERFGIIATDLPFEGWSELPKILPYLGAGRVKLAVWNAQGDIQQADPEGFDKLLIRLKEISVTPTACLLELPPGVARKLTGTTTGWPGLLVARADHWQPQLAYMVSRHANNLDRWQLGPDHSDLFVSQKEMRQVYQRIYAEFAKLIQQPDLAMPWPAWHELDGKLPATVALSVPTSILPHQVPLYMQDVRRNPGQKLSLSLQLLDRERYGREVQIRDLAQRVIYALSAEAQRIDLPLPFSVTMEDEQVVKQPQELLMVMRTLISTLGGTTYRGKVPIADDVEAFLFDKDGQGILVLWDRGTKGSTRRLALNLGARPRSVDLWGNVTPLLRTSADRASQDVQLTVGPMPTFLIDIDGAMAQLRASVAFDRPLIESSFVPHTRKIRFVNTYRQAIAGTLRLKAPAGWNITPPVINFSVNPGETFERDVTIEFPYNSFAGAKPVLAEFSFQDKSATLTVPLTLTLGLSDVGMQTMAMRDGNDLLVQQIFTNYGDKKVNYTAFVIVPGQAREERLVTNLAPGRSTIKLYRFPKIKLPPNTKVRAGVKELTGTRILNDEVEVQ